MNDLNGFELLNGNELSDVSGGWGFGDALSAAGAACGVIGLATGGVGWAVGGVILGGASIGHMIYSNSKHNPNRR